MAGDADEVAAVVEELVKVVGGLAEQGAVFEHDEIRNRRGRGDQQPGPGRDSDLRQGGDGNNGDGVGLHGSQCYTDGGGNA